MYRRYFLKSSGIALASLGVIGASPKFFQQFAAANVLSDRSGGKRKTVVTIFQRGAVDGLNMVVPFGESEYYSVRPSINIPKPNSGNQDAAINLDGFFGLHPAMTAFKPLWDAKKLAIVHASGSPDNTRSHFDAQDYMEAGTPGVKSTRDGWLNRYLQANQDKSATPFRAVSISQLLPRTLLGRAPALAINNLNDFTIRAGSYSQNVQGGFEAIYEQTLSGSKKDEDVLRETGQETFEAVNFLKKANPAQYKAENGARYPQSRLGQSLFQIAQLIKAGVGLEVAFTDCGGWDTHSNEGSARGQLANLLRDFSASIAAFVTDLGPQMDDVVILTMSEFGRTARENGTRGTDHGHANAIFTIGNSVKGGKVYGDWPGLKSSQLYEGRDLAVTTDFRDVFGEVATRHLGAKDLNKIFPGYSLSASKFRSVIG
jgi:uncharacterized protein (DUF1501 family)